MKKRKITTIIMILFFFMGLIILLYPSISDFHNQKVQSKSVVDYEALLEQNKIDYTKELEEATSYNKKLNSLKSPFVNSHELTKYYNTSLNINDNGMMGYLTINKIKVELPIYHGTDETVLSRGVGHIEGSSLPIGGKSTHSVLSAHRGLPTSTLFTDLNKLEIGDTFTIKVLDQTLTYQVDKISVVKPNEISNLKVEKGKDYVTLVTCTPYGINTHRLLVRGIRIENIVDNSEYVTTDSFKISNLVVTPLVVIPIIFILLIIIILKPVKKEKINLEEFIYPSKYKHKKMEEKK